MAERSNAAVLKTVDCNRSGGSNPSLSADNSLKRCTNKGSSVFVWLRSKKGANFRMFIEGLIVFENLIPVKND